MRIDVNEKIYFIVKKKRRKKNLFECENDMTK